MLLLLQSVYLGLILLNHVVILYLAFWESTKLFSIAVVPLYISIRNALKFQFIVILTNTCYFSVLFCFYNNYPNRCEVVSNWHLDILKHFLSQGTQNNTGKLLWIILSYKKVIVPTPSHVQLFATPWTVAHQAPPSMGFSRQEYWSGLPFLSPGDLLDPGIKPKSPTLQADALTSEPAGKPLIWYVRW